MAKQRQNEVIDKILTYNTEFKNWKRLAVLFLYLFELIY